MDDHIDPTAFGLDDRFAIGQPVPRSEDPVLLRGEGRYSDDISLPGQAYAVMVRSHHAHGVIRGIDTAAARAMPGILAIYAAADLAAGEVGPLPPRQVMNNRDGTSMLSPVRYALATDSRDIDSLVALFIDDVRVGRDTYGRDALRADFDRSLSMIGVSILQVTNHIIDFADDDHASGVVYCYAQTEQDGEWIVQQIQYRDTYERRSGIWYFVRRIHWLWYGADLLTRPLGLTPADYRRGKWGKGELPEAFTTWGPFWDRVGRPAPSL